jgi:tagatose 6-phosphate kinase
VTRTAWPGRLIGVSLNPSIDKIVEVPVLLPGAIHRPTVLSAVAGGKALNAARAAAALGLPASVVTIVGGQAGSWLRGRLLERQIPGWFIDSVAESRTCLSVLDRATGELTEFYEPGLELPDDRWPDVEQALSDSLARDPADALVVLAGSLPPGAPGDAYGRLATLARARGARVAVDVSGPPLEAGLRGGPWLVKVNAAEAAASTCIPTERLAGVAEAAAELRKAGAEVAIVTMGIRGAILATTTGTWVAGPPPAIGPFGVGSGDALLAGFAAGLHGGMELPDALRLGIAAGAANALTPGQGDLDAADVERMLPACSVTAFRSD